MKTSQDGSASFETYSDVEILKSRHESVASLAALTTKTPDVMSEAKPAWKDLFAFVSKRNISPLLAAVTLALAAGAINPVQSIVLGQAFDKFTSYGAGSLQAEEFKSHIGRNGVYFVALGVSAWVFQGGSFMAWVVFGETQARIARTHLFDGLLQKSVPWFDTRPSGIAAQLPRLETQIREVQLALSQPMGSLAQQMTTAIAALIIAFVYSWDLTLVTIATLPVMAIVLMVVSARIQPSVLNQQKELESASKVAINAFSNIETVKCFNGEDVELSRYLAPIERAAYWYRRQISSNSFQIGMSRFITLALFVQAFWYGHHLVVSGKKSTGDVLTTFWSALTATQALELMMPQLIVLEKGRTAGFALKSTTATTPLDEVKGKTRPSHCYGEITIQQITFSYPARPKQLALHDVSFTVPPGTTTFIVGKSGSGKSTLGQLLLQFYKPSYGLILLDGQQLESIDPLWLRDNITLVEQNSVLFQGTLQENISLGVPDSNIVSADAIRLAAEFSLLQQTINDLPEGMETKVGARGGSLSGGQRQRMALARARLRDTPILILDESTSALDNITRSLVMSAIRMWRSGRTTLIVTHDISQIQGEDYVLVMENGRLVQEGHRDELDDSPGQPFHKFTQEKTASDEQQEPSTITSPRSPMHVQEIDIFLDQSLAAPSPGFRFIPSMLSNRFSITSLGLGPLQAPQSDVARWSSYQTTSTRLAPLKTGVDHDQEKSRTTQQRSNRLSQSAMELVDFAAQAAIESRAMMISRRRKSQRSQDVEAVNILSASASQRPPKGGLEKHKDPSITAILATVLPTLDTEARIWLILGIFSVTIHAVATPMFSWMFAQLISTFYAADDGSSATLRWSMGILAIAIVDGISCYCFQLLIEFCGQRWVDHMRSQAMRKILCQAKSFFAEEEHEVPTLVAQLDRSAEEMRNLLGRFAPFAYTGLIILVMALIWAMVESWKLTLVSISVAPVSYCITRGFQNISAKYEGLCNDAAEHAASIRTETFTSIKTVRSLTLEKVFTDKHSRASAVALQVGIKRALYCGFFHGLSESLVFFITALVFYYGAVLAASGAFPITNILTVFSMLLFGLSNVTAIMEFLPQIGSSMDTAQRLLTLANLPEQSHEHRGDLEIENLESIGCNGLTFAYESRPNDQVLRGIHLEFRHGLSTALVGPSGSGKSTIASLLLRLYPTPPRWYRRDAQLTIDQHDISSISTRSLRRLMVVVPQTCVLFPASVAENIAYGLPSESLLRTERKIRLAAQAAGIDECFSSLPNGYQTAIGDGGLGLSGGQAQRLAIARALVREPKVLILDEATSALDVESAALIRNTIKNLMRERPGMMVIMITHDRAMMEMADRVVMLEEGRIVEEGAFEELLDHRGRLANLLSGGQWVGDGTAS